MEKNKRVLTRLTIYDKNLNIFEGAKQTARLPFFRKGEKIMNILKVENLKRFMAKEMHKL